MMNELAQIFNTVNIGLVILDRELNVVHWNRWMEIQSGIKADAILGAPLFDHFPTLNNPYFLKNCKSVLTFGSFSFFSQKLHKFVFPFKPHSSLAAKFDFMQQSCSMGPLRSDDKAIERMFLIVQDVTEIAAYENQLIELNIKDPLTGIFNRRHLEARLREEVERHRRHKHGLSLAMIDIDHFKKVNDTYGHPCGDQVLIGVAQAVAGAIRSTDLVGRYGGEEFCCVLPETSIAGAFMLMERIRAKIAAEVFCTNDTNLSVTISIGVAEIGMDQTGEQLLGSADTALYEAKHSGRNRVVKFEDIPQISTMPEMDAPSLPAD